MKKLKQTLFTVLRLGIGIGIVVFLIRNIDKSSLAVRFETAPVTVEDGAVYVSDQVPGVQFAVTETVNGGTALSTRLAQPPEHDLPPTGTLTLETGTGPDAINWIDVTVEPCGLQLLGESFRVAGMNWPMLVLAAALAFTCLCFCVVRWRIVLEAMGLDLPFRKTWSIFFIGHFFNSFLFGATGGDVVKAYYTARETGHRKTEAVSTVFIDRSTGLLGLLILTTIMMLVRRDFFMADIRTRYVLVFMSAIMAATVVAFIVMLAAKRIARILDRFPLFRTVVATRPAQVLSRAYNSFYLCLTHPVLLAKTIGISVVNHVTLIAAIAALGRSMLVDLPFKDYLAIGTTINVIGAIPITPGGLGVRESAAVIYFDVVNVPAAQALPISLLVYAVMLLWSLFGGIVFLFYSGGSQHTLKEDMTEAAKDDA